MMRYTRRWLFLTVIGIFVQGWSGLSPATWAQGQPLTFSVMADIPYNNSEAVVLQQQIAAHNKYSPSEFVAHLGDLRGTSAKCVELNYSSVADILKALTVPCFIVTGDNEYNDCANPAQGWAWWAQYFMDFEKNFCGAPVAERQSVRPENFAFVRNGVLFIGINLVAGRVHDLKEWNTRMQDDADWVSRQFQAKVAQVRTAVIFAHAGPDDLIRNLFFDQFRRSAAAFAKPVLLMHGNGHAWIKDYPFPEPNILRVQVNNGNPDVLPVQVTVTLDTRNMFVFEQKPWSRKSLPFNMPPCVNAGPDQIITFSQPATLNASVSDDGDPNPPGAITTTWSKVSGPNMVTFENANALVTTARFSGLGTYVLRLTANDSKLQNSDDVTIVVNDGRPIINTFSPAIGATGTEVTITGNYFTDAMSVAFDGKAATSFTVDNAAQIRATVPSGAATGKIGVTNAAGTGLSTTDFIVQRLLAVNTFGYGSVTLDPSGGLYDTGTVVTLTATPFAGYQFSGWSGDLSPVSGTNPATITMNADKNLTAIFTSDSPSDQITHQETQTGGSSETTVVKTSTSLIAISGQLYLAAISTRPKASVLSVSGLGLNWTLVKAQCSGRNSTGLEVWMAQGISRDARDNGPVTATLASKPNSAVIAVSRYAGVEGVTPNGNVISGNTNGANGLCSGGEESSLYSFNLATTTGGAMIYGAVAMRVRTHTPGAGYTERAEIKQGSTDDITASVAAEDQMIASVPQGGITVNGTFNGKVNWAFIALEMRPQLNLTINTLGSGSVALNPPGDNYNVGTVVTLTARPASGFQFTGWSGDLIPQGGTTNPVTITMNGHKTVTATFTPLPPSQFTLTVNKIGSGSVVLNPSGLYDAGTAVTLTATPAAGYQFSGWSGDLTTPGGVVNPATITMDANKTVMATFNVAPVLINIVHEETKTGGSSSSTTVTTSANLTGVNDHLYLAAISMRPKVSVLSVSGLGLNWTLVKSKCAGYNTTAIEVWMAQGTPSGHGSVTATLAGAPGTAVIAVSHYSGVATSNPIGNLLAGNTNGVNTNGVCSGGVDASSYSFNLTTTANKAVVYSAIAIKNQTHTPGADYTERGEIQQLHVMSSSGVAVGNKSVASAATVTVNGSFSGAVDYAAVALEIKPQLVIPFTLTVNKTGSGSVVLNPPGGVYTSGTVVTLIPQSGTGFEFNGWSGDLDGSANPATITMNGNKTVTATFISNGSVVHEETRTGVSSNSAIIKTSASLTGASEHLYLAAISTVPKVMVNTVSGLGLTWTLVRSKCAGYNSTAIEVWMAQGTPTDNDAVTAIFAGAPSTAVIAVSRYSGVVTSNPIGNVLAGNTNGMNWSGVCSGGVDNNAYSFNLNTTINNARIYGATAMKARTHTPGAGYSERAEVRLLNSAYSGAVAVEDMTVASPAPVTVNGLFDGAVDWALVAVEIKPAATLGKRDMTANANATPPTAFQLEPNYPNPFSPHLRGIFNTPSTAINFSLPAAGNVRLNIYDVTGQLVRVLVAGEMAAGRYSERWDGRDNFGRGVAAGTYLYQIVVTGEDGNALFTQTLRMTLVK